MLNLKTNLSYYKLKITGKDVKRFLQNLYKMHINILDIDYQKKSVIIKVNEYDYEKIKNIKTIYEIEIVKYYGLAKLKIFFKNYYLFLIIFSIGSIMFLGLTNIIFDVEVVHSNKELRELLLEELKEQGITKNHLVVSYSKKELIKQEILKKYQDKIEWLEIERQGTKYVVKVEERKKLSPLEDEIPRNIIASKNGLITKIESSQGEILVKKDQFVRKGDILISGAIHNKEEITGFTKAKGNVYAETWYTVTVELPCHYHEEIETKNSQTILNINFFNKNINIFQFNKYKNSIMTSKYKLSNHIIPFSISISKEQEIIINDKIYTKENAIIEASEMAQKKLKENLGQNIEIKYEKNLKIIEENSKIKVVIFYKLNENITDYQLIEEKIEE